MSHKLGTNRVEKIAATYVQMLKEENKELELRSRIPEACKLTMKDVIKVVENGKKFYVIEPHDGHLIILDSTNEHFKDRHNDRTDGRGYKRIGLFYGKNVAYTGDTADEWIVINRKFSEYVVQQFGKGRVEKVASVANDLYTLIEALQENELNIFDKDQWIDHNQQILTTLTHVVNKLDKTTETWMKKINTTSKKSVKIAKGKSRKTISECKRSTINSCPKPIVLRDSAAEHPLDISFVYNTETVFDLQQDLSLSNRDFMARDQNGNSFVRFEGGLISGNVHIYDVRNGADRHIFTMSPHIFTIHNTMTIERAFMKDKDKSHETLPDTTFSTSILNFCASYSTYYLRRDEKELYTFESGFLGLTFTVYDTHRRQAAKISRGVWQYDAYNNYHLQCAPGSDILLCLIGMVGIDIVAQRAHTRKGNAISAGVMISKAITSLN